MVLVTVGAAVWWLQNPRPDEVRSIQVTNADFGVSSVAIECFFPSAPRESKSKLPTILIFHGVEGTSYYRNFHLTNARRIADEGYAVALVHYFDPLPYKNLVYLKNGTLDRDRIEEHIYGEQRADRGCWVDVAVQAIDWVTKQPEMDSEKVFLMGYSLGGCVALSCADRCSRDSDLPEIRGLVVNFASRFRDVEISAKMPATQFHHGADDEVIPEPWMRQTADEMKELGSHVEVNVYQNQQHTLDDKSGEICRQRTQEFLAGLLREPDSIER